jgi:hypothetical protein
MGAETLTAEGNAAERFYVSTQTDPTESGRGRGKTRASISSWAMPAHLSVPGARGLIS